MQGICHCSFLCRILMCWTIVLLLVQWRRCSLLALLFKWPTGKIWSIAGYPVYVWTGDFLDPFSLLYLENGVVLWESTVLVGLIGHHDRDFWWGISECLVLYIFKIRYSLITFIQTTSFYLLLIPAMIVFGCTIAGLYCDIQDAITLIVLWVRGGRLNWGALRSG